MRKRHIVGALEERPETEERWTAFAALQLGLILVTATAFALTVLLTNESYDDAYISYRYAEHWAGGIGLKWNPQDPPVYGASSVAHCFLLTIGKLIGIHPRAASVTIQVVSHAAMSALAFLLVAPSAGRWAALGAGILTAVSLPNVFQGQGLEIEMYTALTLVALSLSIKQKYWAAGLTAGLAMATRLDGATIVGVVVISSLFDERRLSAAMRVIGGAAAPVCIWLVGTTLYFGSPLPQSMWAKLASNWPPPFRIYGIFELWAGEPIIAMCLPFAVIGAAACAIHRERVIVLWLAMYLCAYRFSGMPSYGWYYPPAMTAIYVLTFMGMSELVQLARRFQHAPVLFGILVFVVSLFVMVSKGVAGPVRAAWAGAPQPSSPHIAAAKWLKENADDGDRVLAYEIGKIGYVSGLYVIDMFGLVSPDVLPYLSAGGFTEVIRKTRFDYAFVLTERNVLPTDQTFRTVWTSENEEYRIVVREEAVPAGSAG